MTKTAKTTPKKRKPRRSKGSVFQRKRKRGGVYPGFYIRWTDAWGERHLEFGGMNRDAAEGLLRKRLDGVDISKRTGARPLRLVSFADIKDQLLKHWTATLTPSTLAGRAGFVDRTAEHFGAKPLAHISGGEVSHWLNHLKLKDGLKAATIRHYAAVLSSAYSYAIQAGFAETNPVKGVPLPKADKREVPFITDEQRRNLYAHMPAAIRPCVMLMGDAGLRRGEVLALTWEQMGPKFDSVTVARSKNHKPRLVPLPKRTRDALQALWDARPSTPIEGPNMLFDISSHDLNTLFRAGADKAGMKWMTPHALRHCYASWLMQRGVPITDVQKLLGHADIQMTARYAQHAPADSGRRAVAALDADIGHSSSSSAIGGS
jgi:integrase